MPLDGTIKRTDGHPLGSFSEVQSALSAIFPGLALQRSPSGVEKLRLAEAQGSKFPEALREHFLSSPSKLEGDYEGADFSIEFFADVAETISEIGVELRGTTTTSEPLFALLEERFGWILTHP